MKILKSQIASIPNFEVLVASHSKMVREWKEHMGRVEADEKSGISDDKKHIAFKRPSSFGVVEDAVDENGNANYEIVDDGPTADQKLEIRKQEIEHNLHAAVNAAIEAIAPRRQTPLLDMKESDIVTSHSDKLIKIQSQGLLKSIINPTPIPEMSAEDKAFVEQQKARRQKIVDIRRASVQALADIDGLTAETIGEWKLPSFS